MILIEAAWFYESRLINLGNKFLDAVEKALSDIRNNPKMWKADELGRSKCRVWKFPYLLIYKVHESQIYILAVAHTSRAPGYWKFRDTKP